MKALITRITKQANHATKQNTTQPQKYAPLAHTLTNQQHTTKIRDKVTTHLHKI
jgi:hypothetical protein